MVWFNQNFYYYTILLFHQLIILTYLQYYTLYSSILVFHMIVPPEDAQTVDRNM
jgi:hypothetical protein